MHRNTLFMDVLLHGWDVLAFGIWILPPPKDSDLRFPAHGFNFPTAPEWRSFPTMVTLLASLQDQPVQEFAAGDILIGQGDCTGLLYILIEGTVEVTKDGVSVTKSNEPGAIFGDLAALLGEPHTAAVRALTPARFHVVVEAKEFLEQHPAVNLHLCKLLARRLDAVNQYLVDLKQQFAGHDHLGMVDGMLDMLMHRQPRERVVPKRSTLRDPEVED